MSPSAFIKKYSGNAGIAIGPILLIIALIAILATAIAAGSSSFATSSGQEGARSLASSLIGQCSTYKAAVARLVALGCRIDKIDWRQPNWPSGTSWTSGDTTGGNGTNLAGNGSCALYDIRGGALVFGKFPDATLMTSTMLITASTYGDPQMAYWQGYPMISASHCVANVGRCISGNSNIPAFVTLHYAPVYLGTPTRH